MREKQNHQEAESLRLERDEALRDQGRLAQQLQTLAEELSQREEAVTRLETRLHRSELELRVGRVLFGLLLLVVALEFWNSNPKAPAPASEKTTSSRVIKPLVHPQASPGKPKPRKRLAAARKIRPTRPPAPIRLSFPSPGAAKKPARARGIDWIKVRRRPAAPARALCPPGTRRRCYYRCIRRGRRGRCIKRSALRRCRCVRVRTRLIFRIGALNVKGIESQNIREEFISQIKQMVWRHRFRLRACYFASRRKFPRPRPGGITVRWFIQPNGRVHAATAVDSSVRSRHLASCVLSRVRRWRFGKHRQKLVMAEHRFLFEAVPYRQARRRR